MGGQCGSLSGTVARGKLPLSRFICRDSPHEPNPMGPCFARSRDRSCLLRPWLAAGCRRCLRNTQDHPRVLISLNFAGTPLVWNGLLPSHANQIKARTFEVPGAGGFLLTETADGLERYYTPGTEIETFTDIENLAKKIRHYLARFEARDAIARAGFERTRREHTYDQRVRELLEFACVQRREHIASRSTTAEINWNEFRRTSQRHTMPTALRWLRSLLISVCSMVWGPQRGPRAARRLMFEVSWRVLGAKTYSAAGLPGRMFYKE
jgi:spore maturation protein CgeB